MVRTGSVTSYMDDGYVPDYHTGRKNSAQYEVCYQYFFRNLRHFNTWIGIVDQSLTQYDPQASWIYFIVISAVSWVLVDQYFQKNIWDLWLVTITDSFKKGAQKMLTT